jgi:hypothetical protein
MPKRLFAGVVGILSLCACYIASAFAIEALDDFKYSGIEWWAVVGELTMCLMAITSLSIGIRFLRFAWTGGQLSLGGPLRPLLLGAGLFFPGFVFTLPLTMFVGSRFAPVGKQDKWLLGGFAVSFCIGIVTGTVGSVLLFRRHRAAPQNRHVSERWDKEVG